MSPFFAGTNRSLLITLFDIFILVVIFYFIKGYYMLTPIAVKKIDDVQYTFRIIDEGAHFRLNLTVKNLSDSLKSFRSHEGHYFEFEASQGEKRLWTWSKDKFFLRSDAAFTLNQNESKEFNTGWDKLDDWGQRVKPGHYDVRCRLMLLSDEPVLSIKLRIKESSK